MPIRSLGPCKSASMPMGLSCFFFYLAYDLSGFTVVIMIAVGKIEAEHIGSGEEKRLDFFFCI